MPFHRLTVPAYSGGLPATHDYINNAVVGVPAPASPQQSGGVYDGTYIEVPGEDATAANVNRANVALAENDDFVDDILNASQPTPAFAQDTGVGQTSLQVAADIFVGKVGTADTQDNRDLLAVIIDSSGNEIVNAAGTRVTVSEIRDNTNSVNVIGTEASGYHSQPYFHFNVPMPSGVTFRIVLFLRGTYTGFADSSGTGKMGDLAGRLLTNLGRQLAWTTPFVAGLSAWADASNLASVTTQGAIDEVVDSLASLPGSGLVGAAGHVGANFSLSAGSVESQLQEIANTQVHDLTALTIGSALVNTSQFSTGDLPFLTHDIRLQQPQSVVLPAGASVDNWNPTNWLTHMVWRITPDTGGSTITGLTENAFGGGELKLLMNVATAAGDQLILSNQNASSTATNRIITPGGVDFVIGSGGSAWVWYDNVSGRWRTVGAKN